MVELYLHAVNIMYYDPHIMMAIQRWSIKCWKIMAYDSAWILVQKGSMGDGGNICSRASRLIMTSRGTSSMWKQCNVLLWLPITHYTTHHGQMVGFVCTQGDVDSCGKLVMTMVFGEICTWPPIRDLWLWHASWMCVQTLGVNYNNRCTANQNFSHNLWKIMRWKNGGMWWAYHSCPWFRAILFSLVNYFTYSVNHDLMIHYSSPALSNDSLMRVISKNWWENVQQIWHWWQNVFHCNRPRQSIKDILRQVYWKEVISES